MKKMLFTLFAILPFVLIGQTTGEITYKETIKFEIELPEGMEQFADKIPNSQQLDKVLLFNEEATIYKNAKKNNESSDNMDMSSGDGQMQFVMQFDTPDNQLFTELASEETIEKRDFMGKNFIVEGTTKRYRWKMTKEQKTILDYKCQKAIFKDTSATVIAWFTTQIPVSAGPGSYAGLPGMILELDIDDGKQVTVATAVDLKKIEKDMIKKPKKGKKVTEAEFDKIIEQKTKEMQEELGGSGNMIIKTERH